MRRHICFILTLLCLLAFGCQTDPASEKADTPAGMWNLGSRYVSTYGTLRHAYTYEKDGQTFYLTVARNRKTESSAQEILSSDTQNGQTYSLCKGKKKDEQSEKEYTYYECLTGSFRYFIGKDEPEFHAENLLSMPDAIRLIDRPDAQIDGITLLSEEWSAYYRLDSCNLEISVFPDDHGAQHAVYAATYEQQTESEESYLYSETDGVIVYTDGTSTVLIRQANRSGKEHHAYNTLSECKAILALLGTNQEA